MSIAGIEIKLGGSTYQATADYEISGNYHAQTMESPEEFPEVEVMELWIDCQKFDLTEMLNDSDFNDHVIELVLETLEE